jgi:hypothetical protein
MNPVTKSIARKFLGFTLSLLSVALASPSLASETSPAASKAPLTTVKVSLSEWKVELTPNKVPPGPVVLEVSNAGSIPHAFEVEGHSVEQSTPQIQPGATATLKLDLGAGSYEAYCPVGKGSHKMLGMNSHLTVGSAKPAATIKTSSAPAKYEEHEATEAYPAGQMPMDHEMAMKHDDDDDDYAGAAKSMKVSGGGPVIQILPGPFPFADSAAAVIRNRPPDQQADLTHKAQMGPYSNNVASISGDISLLAIDRGASGDSVSGVAKFTAADGSRWKVVMDRVQTKDIPFNPRFGGVIMGLFYHGASGVHTPLVPTIQSSLALWAYAHLYKNDQLVADNAMVHIMLLSRTRRPTDWALDCWDCSARPIQELQLQVTPAPNTPPFDAPGGFLFVNWEKSNGQRTSL